MQARVRVHVYLHSLLVTLPALRAHVAGGGIAALIRGLVLASALPEVRVKEWLSPGLGSFVQLKPTFTAFHAAAALRVGVPTEAAKVYWFDPEASGDVLPVERRKAVTATTYDGFVAACRGGHASTVHVYASIPAAPSPLQGRAAAVPAAGAEKGVGARSTSTGRLSGFQNLFKEQVRQRDVGPDGKPRCVLCGPDFPGLPHTPPEAAHVIRWERPIADVKEAGLLSAWDVRNGVMLCKACHTQFDAFLWHVGPDDRVVVANALLDADDEVVRRYWAKRNGRRLVRPLPPHDASWPLPPTWAAHARGVGAKQKKRHAKDFPCDVCGHLCKDAQGVKQHKDMGACGRHARQVFVTPRRRRRGGGAGHAPPAPAPRGGAGGSP